MKLQSRTLFLVGVCAFSVSTLPAAHAQAAAATQTTHPVQGSIPLPQEGQSEQSEAATFDSMAKVSLDQAVKAAQDSLGVSRSPSSAQLGDEDGFLAWEVVIGDQSVLIDAGNATVLQTERVGADDTNDDGEEMGDQNEAGQEMSDQNEADQEAHSQAGTETQDEGDSEDGD